MKLIERAPKAEQSVYGNRLATTKSNCPETAATSMRNDGSVAAGGIDYSPLPIEHMVAADKCDRWLPEEDDICAFCIEKWKAIICIALFLQAFKSKLVG